MRTISLNESLLCKYKSQANTITVLTKVLIKLLKTKFCMNSYIKLNFFSHFRELSRPSEMETGKCEKRSYKGKQTTHMGEKYVISLTNEGLSIFNTLL